MTALRQRRLFRVKAGKKPRPFDTTHRFWWGRIVDALGESSSLSLVNLLEALPHPNRDEARVRAFVHTPHEVSMVEYDPDMDEVRLPRG